MRGLLQAVLLLAVVLSGVACGTGERENSQEQTAEITSGVSTETATASTPTPAPGLTDTGYLGPDGSPLYAECIGVDPLTGTTLALPPTYPTPSGQVPLPTPPAEPNPNPRPPEDELPPFDVLSVAPLDATAWPQQTTPCLGGISFANSPEWIVDHLLTVGGYQQGAGAALRSSDQSAKVDFSMYYTTDDQLQRRSLSSAGNGVYYLQRNTPVAVGGVPGVVSVSSEIVEATEWYVVINYLLNPRPDWYIGIVGFFDPPFEEADFADFQAMVQSLSVGAE